MLDREKYDQVISGDAFSSAAESTIFEDIKDWDVEELLELRASIDALLPASNLSEMNLEGELVRQYYRVVALQTRTLGDERTPANQLAQVSNVVASTLQQLVKMQMDVRRDEQLKLIEVALLEAIQDLPQEAKDSFFARYEKIAERVGAMGKA